MTVTFKNGYSPFAASVLLPPPLSVLSSSPAEPSTACRARVLAFVSPDASVSQPEPLGEIRTSPRVRHGQTWGIGTPSGCGRGL